MGGSRVVVAGVVALCRVDKLVSINNSVTDRRTAERLLDVERVRYETAPFVHAGVKRLIAGSVAEAQAVHVCGHQVDALFTNVRRLSRHVAVTAIAQRLAYGVGNALTRCLIQPDIVG